MKLFVRQLSTGFDNVFCRPPVGCQENLDGVTARHARPSWEQVPGMLLQVIIPANVLGSETLTASLQRQRAQPREVLFIYSPTYGGGKGAFVHVASLLLS